MSATAERVRQLVAPLLTEPDLVLYDVEYTGGTLKVVLDRPGGVDMGSITAVTRAVSAALDEADIVPSSYTLEVSSPGLERSLRTPEHFAGAIGREVRIKLRPGIEGDRRLTGTLTAADDTTATLALGGADERVVRLDDITKANVHVDWSPPPKPGSKGSKSGGQRRPDTPEAPSSSDTPTSSDTPSEATP